jgi:DNA-binding transcriptional regulator YdaS (Cro superfamily)
VDLKTYLSSKDGRLSREGKEIKRIARLCDTQPFYVYQVALNHKQPSPEFAANLEYATAGEVDRRVTLPQFPWDKPRRK